MNNFIKPINQTTTSSIYIDLRLLASTTIEYDGEKVSPREGSPGIGQTASQRWAAGRKLPWLNEWVRCSLSLFL